MSTSGIYKITNIHSGKIYVGQSVNIEHRWWVHGALKSECVKIRNAIIKHGRAKFTFDILEVLDRNIPNFKHIITEREQFYLDTLQPFGDRGYNICRTANAGPATKGVPKTGRSAAGLHHRNNVPVICYNEEGEVVAEYHNVITAAKACGIDRMGIFNCLAGRSRVAAGLFWSRRGETPNIRPRYMRSRERRGPAYNRKAVIGVHHTSGERIRFDSIVAAAKFMGVTDSAIRNAIRNGCNSHGYSWVVL